MFILNPYPILLPSLKYGPDSWNWTPWSPYLERVQFITKFREDIIHRWRIELLLTWWHPEFNNAPGDIARKNIMTWQSHKSYDIWLNTSIFALIGYNLWTVQLINKAHNNHSAFQFIVMIPPCLQCNNKVLSCLGTQHTHAALKLTVERPHSRGCMCLQGT